MLHESLLLTAINLANSNPLDLASTSSPEAPLQCQSALPAGKGFRALSSTQVLIAANLIIFLVMLLHRMWLAGIQPSLSHIGTDFDDKLMLLWGGNYGPLTLGGQYWRVLTCLFVHLNIFHLAGNMLFLWRLGKPLDRLLGSKQALAIYLFTGVASSLTSLVWHPTFLKLGPSGAIVGQAGVLIALLALAKLNLPRRQVLGILPWIIFLMPVGLLFGHFDKTTDYAAHLGGLVSGLAIGVPLAWTLRGSPLKRVARQRRVLAFTAFALVLSFGVVIAGRYDVVRQHRQRLEMNAFLIAAAKEAISKNPNDAVAHQQLATLYLGQSEYDEAMGELRCALEIKPGDPDALSQLLITSMEIGRVRDAIPLFRENLAKGPVTAGKYASFSLLLELTGNLNEAEEMARKAVELDSNSKRSHQQLASVLEQLHKTEEAERERKLADQIPESQ
ncbi:MAG TPA: rhomboid family intramembrane serine protease [Candidatus Angelobacter sp.]|nr:rhomboid family intramembrane serine protease [Candidatus Angelobacter sp.]